MPIVISDKAIEALKQSNVLKSLVADELEISVLTMQGLINNRDQRFTQAGVVKIMTEYTGLAADEILTKKDATKKVAG